jgi:asparagine synthase (glutamine-hydrolysing)
MHEYKLTSKEYFSQIDSALDTFSQPFGGVTSTYFISKHISERHKVCLTGDGADELFGSYRNIQRAARIHYGIEDSRTWQFVNSELNLNYFLNEPINDYDRNEDRTYFFPLKDELSDFQRTTDVFNFALIDAQLKLLPEQVLLFSDHLGMAHGLEIRPPFLSKAIIEFSRKIPLEYLIDSNGTTKLILKKLALRYFDKNFVERKKEGFMLPLNQWMRKKEAKDWANLKLDEYIKSSSGLLDPSKIQKFFNDFYQERNNDFFMVYRLSVLMHYLRDHA